MGPGNSQGKAAPVEQAVRRGQTGWRATHCKRGHELTEANRYTNGKTSYCKTCHLLQSKVRTEAKVLAKELVRIWYTLPSTDGIPKQLNDVISKIADTFGEVA